jgi:multidrug resistance efflux pump
MRAEQALPSDRPPEYSLSGLRLRRDLVINQVTDAKTGETAYFVKVPGSGEAIRFGEREYFLCQSLDLPFEQIQQNFRERFGMPLTDKQFMSFLADLNRLGLVYHHAVESGPRDTRESRITVVPMEAQAASTSKKRGPYHFPLAGPTPVLGVLVRLFHPVRYAAWALAPAVLLAALTLFHHQLEFSADLKRYMDYYSYIPHLIVSLFVINLISKIVFGAVLCAHGVTVRTFGVRLLYGMVPRFYVDPDAQEIWELPRLARLQSYSAPLLAKLAIFALGTLLWIGFRSTGTFLPDLGLMLSQFALGAFLFTANPLWPSSAGYHCLSSLLDRRYLQFRALRFLEMRLKRRPAPPALSTSNKWGLLLFGAAMIFYFGTFITVVLFYIGAYLEQRYRGTGVAMFLAIVALFSLWLWATRLSRWRSNGATGDRGGRVQSEAHSMESGERVAQGDGLGLDALYSDPGPRRPRWRAWLGWAVALGILGVVAILPYHYEAGGNFVVYPSSRAEVRASTDGVVTKILVREGEWVEAGAVLAYLAHDDEEKSLDVSRAELKKAVSDLRVLEHGAKQEAIEVAQKQVEQAEVNVNYSKTEAERYAQLLKQDAVPAALAAEMEAKYQADLAALAVARSNLALVKSDALEDQLNAARAQVSQLSAEVRYREQQLVWTTITAPTAGRIVTPNLDLLLGKYLPVGELLAELQDSRVAHAEIQVPETEIEVVKPGATTRLRAWSDSARTVSGVVVGIAPVAKEDAYGQFVRVLTEVPNGDGYLKAGMTGYAKIAGPRIPVWDAFTRMIQRFFQVEVWSWIP